MSLRCVPKGLIHNNPALVYGLAPIIWTNADAYIDWRIYAALGVDELRVIAAAMLHQIVRFE